MPLPIGAEAMLLKARAWAKTLSFRACKSLLARRGERMANHTGITPPSDPSSAGRSRSSPEFDTATSRGRVPAASVTITTRARGTRQNRVEPRPGPRTMAEESRSSEEPRRHRGASARGRELLDRGVPSSSSQRPVPFISLASVPKPSQPYTNNPIDPNTPAAAFVAGAAIQEANQAAHIAHHAASMAEQQAIEAMRARQLAAQAEEHATHVQSQAQFVVHETRQQAENMVGQARAQAEAMVGHVRAQAEQYVQSQQHEHVQRQRQLEQQAHQWASGVEAAYRAHVDQVNTTASAELLELQRHNAYLTQQLQLAARSPVPSSPKEPPAVSPAPSTQPLHSVRSTLSHQYESSEFAAPFQAAQHSNMPPTAQPVDMQIPKSFQTSAPQEFYVGTPVGTPHGVATPVQRDSTYVAALERELGQTREMLNQVLSLVHAGPANIPSPPEHGVPMPFRMAPTPPPGLPTQVLSACPKPCACAPMPAGYPTSAANVAASSTQPPPPQPGARVLPPSFPVFERTKKADGGSSPSSSSSSSDSEVEDSCRMCGGKHREIRRPHLTMNKEDHKVESTPTASSEVTDYAEHESEIVYVKGLTNLILPNIPVDSGQARGYINQVLMNIGSLQKTPGSDLYHWAQECLTKDDSALRGDKRFPRTDREIATKMLKVCKSGRFGIIFQRMVEESRLSGIGMPCGRVTLARIFRHFQLEKDRIGMLGERNLLTLRLIGTEDRGPHNLPGEVQIHPCRDSF